MAIAALASTVSVRARADASRPPERAGALSAPIVAPAPVPPPMPSSGTAPLRVASGGVRRSVVEASSTNGRSSRFRFVSGVGAYAGWVPWVASAFVLRVGVRLADATLEAGLRYVPSISIRHPAGSGSILFDAMGGVVRACVRGSPIRELELGGCIDATAGLVVGTLTERAEMRADSFWMTFGAGGVAATAFPPFLLELYVGADLQIFHPALVVARVRQFYEVATFVGVIEGTLGVMF